MNKNEFKKRLIYHGTAIAVGLTAATIISNFLPVNNEPSHCLYTLVNENFFPEGTPQYELYKKAEIVDGHLTYEGKPFVAVDKNYGEIGDEIEFEVDTDGDNKVDTEYYCIIGHYSGYNQELLNFLVDTSYNPEDSIEYYSIGDIKNTGNNVLKAENKGIYAVSRDEHNSTIIKKYDVEAMAKQNTAIKMEINTKPEPTYRYLHQDGFAVSMNNKFKIVHVKAGQGIQVGDKLNITFRSLDGKESSELFVCGGIIQDEENTTQPEDDRENDISSPESITLMIIARDLGKSPDFESKCAFYENSCITGLSVERQEVIDLGKLHVKYEK